MSKTILLFFLISTGLFAEEKLSYLENNGTGKVLIAADKAYKRELKSLGKSANLLELRNKYSVNMVFDDGFKQKITPPFKFNKISSYRCPCVDYDFSFYDADGLNTRKIHAKIADPQGFKYYGKNGDEYKISSATSSFKQVIEDTSPKIECNASFAIDDNGHIKVNTDSPEISDYYQDLTVNDDDGFISTIAIFRILKSRQKSQNKNTLLTDNEKKNLKNAMKRFKQYMLKELDSFSVGGKNTDLNGTAEGDGLVRFLSTSVGFASEVESYIKNKSSLSNTELDSIGRFLEVQRNMHTYSNPKDTKSKNSLFEVCSNDPDYRLKCCSKKHIEFNNPFSQSLCNVNFETMKPNLNVYNNNNTKCNYSYRLGQGQSASSPGDQSGKQNLNK